MTDDPGKSPPTSTPVVTSDVEEQKHPSTTETISPQEPPPPPPPSSHRWTHEPEDEDSLGGSMTFLEHLDELRKRILHSAAAVAVAFCLCWAFREPIFRFLAVPISDVIGGMENLIFTRPTEPFTIWLKVSFVGAVFLSSPYILLQIWLFIAPGLYRKEKSYAIPFLLSGTLLFLLGGAFAYYVILPTALEFLINEFGKAFRPMVSAIEYFSFEVVILVGMGVIFQMPVLVAFLSLFGLLTPRFLWKNFRYAVLMIMIVAAVVSPTADALNLFLWSGPMVILYLISIVICWIFQVRRSRRKAEENS